MVEWSALQSGGLQRNQCQEEVGPDGIGPLAIKCLHKWEPDKIVALIRAHVRIGIHHDQWKTVRGVTIPKSGRGDHLLAKSYRVASLLNCLGKMVEKGGRNASVGPLQGEGHFSPGQYGCRAQQSAADAMAAQAQEAWSQGRFTRALLMDVAAAFPAWPANDSFER